MVTAFLLAAGFGNRLRPLTAHIPKALVPVCGVPMLDYALALAKAHGHQEIVVNAHHLWSQVASWAVRHGVQLQVELPEILGTGGGLRAAFDNLADRIAIINADVLSDIDLSDLLRACPDGGAAMVLRPSDDAHVIGAVEADADGTVVRIDKVVEGEGGRTGTHFTGVHAMSRDAIARVPHDGAHCVVRTAYKEMVPHGRVASMRHAGTWLDIGTPAAYLEANLAVLRGEVAIPLDPWERGDRGPDGCWVGPDARIEGTVSNSVIGSGAHVPQGATVTDSVIWDGVKLAPGCTLHRSVAYEAGILEIEKI